MIYGLLISLVGIGFAWVALEHALMDDWRLFQRLDSIKTWYAWFWGGNLFFAMMTLGVCWLYMEGGR